MTHSLKYVDPDESYKGDMLGSAQNVSIHTSMNGSILIDTEWFFSTLPRFSHGCPYEMVLSFRSSNQHTQQDGSPIYN